MSRALRLCLGVTLVGCVLVLPVAAATEPQVITRANAKWREARCTIRISVEIKKGKNKEGWSRSPIYSVGMMHTATPTGTIVESATAKGEKAFYVTMEVSDRDAIEHMLSGKTLPSGTEFIAEGWFLERPEKQEGPYLQLRFAAQPTVKARFWFLLRGSFGGADGFPIEHFEAIERYLRIDAFRLEAVDEKLSDVPSSPVSASAGSPGPPVAAAQRPVQPDAQATSYRPAVRILAVSCQPAQLRAGDEVDLVLSYVVEGLPAGISFEVVERREVLLGEALVGNFDTPIAREAGTFTSTQRIRIPRTANKGLYSFRGTVTMAGLSSSATALLEVRGP